MRQTHAAGEKLFVDFAGDTVPVFDALTGDARECKIFVAVLGRIAADLALHFLRLSWCYALGASRREFFESIDRPALLPLPAEPYQYAEWRRARVAPAMRNILPVLTMFA